ncbi:SIMPL domain-containing protein [Patescibacteria group bacterium]|nr:SIMPL domain-containing protein [Patescibacteria group bacterium]
MADATKKYLNIAIITALLVFAYSCFDYTKTYSKSVEPSSFRSFTTSGEGKVTAIPDVANFGFKVVTEGGRDISSLQEENTNKMNKIIEFVKNEGVEAKDIKTENYRIEPRYQRSECKEFVCPPPEIVGYTINQAIVVKVRDFDKIGSILSNSVNLGANSVSGPSFAIDDMEVARSEARDEAIKKAQEKAEAIADSADFRIGRLLGIYEGGAYAQYYAEGVSLSKAMGGDLAPSIEPGSQDVTVSISLTYEIK